jgi:hypothetical protein
LARSEFFAASTIRNHWPRHDLQRDAKTASDKTPKKVEGKTVLSLSSPNRPDKTIGPVGSKFDERTSGALRLIPATTPVFGHPCGRPVQREGLPRFRKRPRRGERDQRSRLYG